MTKKKELQKVIILFLFSLFLLSSFESTALAVDSKYDCTYAGVSCKGVNVTGHGTSVAYSDYVYAAQGQQLSVSNNSTGQFNLITELVDSSGRVVTAAPVYYTDTVFIYVATAGNYRVKVTCKDDSDKERCTGYGQVSQ